jgi:predicted RNase H-like HicB family nuclease
MLLANAHCPEPSCDREEWCVSAQPLSAVRDYNGSDSPMQRHFDVIIERDSEGYYVASVPQLPGCHTQANSLDAVVDRIREAISLCLEVEGNPSTELEFVGIQRITIAA